MLSCKRCGTVVGCTPQNKWRVQPCLADVIAKVLLRRMASDSSCNSHPMLQASFLRHTAIILIFQVNQQYGIQGIHGTWEHLWRWRYLRIPVALKVLENTCSIDGGRHKLNSFLIWGSLIIAFKSFLFRRTAQYFFLQINLVHKVFLALSQWRIKIVALLARNIT